MSCRQPTPSWWRRRRSTRSTSSPAGSVTPSPSACSTRPSARGYCLTGLAGLKYPYGILRSANLMWTGMGVSSPRPGQAAARASALVSVCLRLNTVAAYLQSVWNPNNCPLNRRYRQRRLIHGASSCSLAAVRPSGPRGVTAGRDAVWRAVIRWSGSARHQSSAADPELRCPCPPADRPCGSGNGQPVPAVKCPYGYIPASRSCVEPSAGEYRSFTDRGAGNSFRAR